jgi:hypothetical protein
VHALLLGLSLGIGAGIAPRPAAGARLLRGAGPRWALRGSGVLLLAAGVALAVEGVSGL